MSVICLEYDYVYQLINIMKKKLFQEAFKKAENQCGNNTKHGLSNHLEKVFTDDLKFVVNKITFVRYYEKYINDDDNVTNNPGSDLLNKISEYLGFESYEVFVSKNSDIEKEGNVKPNGYSKEDVKKPNAFYRFIKEHKITIVVSFLLLIGFVIYYSLNKQRWMVWSENHYIEVKFDIEKYDIKKLKPLKEERIEHFKKINADCNTKFFNSSGEVKVWYGKSSKKELEYFTDLGLHPETGKTLYPITVYMINKHICSD